MLLQTIAIDNLEKNLGQPFLCKLAADKKYFEDSKYVGEKHLPLKRFISAYYKPIVGEANFKSIVNTALYLALENDNKKMIRVLKEVGVDISSFIKEYNDKAEICKRISNQNFTSAMYSIANLYDSWPYDYIKAYACAITFGTVATYFADQSNGSFYLPLLVTNSSCSFGNAVSRGVAGVVGLISGGVIYKIIQNFPQLKSNISLFQQNKTQANKHEQVVEKITKLLSEIEVDQAAIGAKYPNSLSK